MLDEIRRENGSDRIKTAEKCSGNAVKAHRGNGGFAARPLHDTRQIIKSRSEARKRAADDDRHDDIPFFRHTAIFCGVSVISRSLQLISELGLIKYYPYHNRNNDRHGNCNRNVLVAVKQFIKSERGDNGASVHADNAFRIRAGRLFHIRQKHIDTVKAYPVQHNAADNLIHIAIGFQKSADGSENRSCDDCEQNTRIPRKSPCERGIKRNTCTDDILSRNAYIEKTGFIAEQDRKRTEDQRNGRHECRSEVLYPKR